MKHQRIIFLLVSILVAACLQACSPGSPGSPTLEAAPTETATRTPAPPTASPAPTAQPATLLGWTGKGELNQTVFTADGRFLLAAYDSEISVLDAASLEEIDFYELSDGAHALSLFPGGLEAAVGTLQGEVIFLKFDPASGKLGQPARPALVAQARIKSTGQEYPHAVHVLAVSPDGRILGVASGNEVQFWNLDAQHAILPEPFKTRRPNFNQIQFSSDSQFAWVASTGNEIEVVFDLRTGGVAQQVASPGQFVGEHEFARQLNSYFSAAGGPSYEILSTLDMNPARTIDLQDPYVKMAFTPDGVRFVIVVAGTSNIQEYDTLSGNMLRSLHIDGYMDGVLSLVGDWAFMVGATYDVERQQSYCSITGWNLATRKRWSPVASELLAPDFPCQAAFISGQVALYSPAGLLLLNPGSEDKRALIEGDYAAVTALAFSPDGKRLAAGRSDGSLQLHDNGSDLRKLHELALETLPPIAHRWPTGVTGLAFMPDGQALVATTSSGNLDWIPTGGQDGAPLSFNPQGQFVDLYGLAVSPDSGSLATGGYENAVRVWQNLATGAPTYTILEDSSEVSALAYSPDGRSIAAGTNKGYIRIWNLAAQSLERTLTGHSAWIDGLDFLPSGDLLASVSEDGYAGLWQVQDGAEALALALGEPGTCMALDPQGVLWSIGTASGKVYLWNVVESGWAGQIETGISRVNALAFSPDGARLAVGTDSGQVQLWQTRDGRGRLAVFSPGEPVSSEEPVNECKIDGGVRYATLDQQAVYQASLAYPLAWEVGHNSGADCSSEVDPANIHYTGTGADPASDFQVDELGTNRLRITALVQAPLEAGLFQPVWSFSIGGEQIDLSASMQVEELQVAPVLPAPLYYIDQDGSVMHLESDGRAHTQVIEAPVQCMDVNRLDGSLAFLRQDALYLADADGGNRRQLLAVAGCPAWAPGGELIAYTLNGVKVVNVTSGEVRTLREDLHSFGKTARRYQSILAWSPFSNKLIALATGWESMRMVVLDLPTDDRFTLTGASPSWSRDGETIYTANPVMNCYMGDLPYILRTNINIREPETLLGNAENDLSGGYAPIETPDGRLLAFVGTSTQADPCAEDPVSVTLFAAHMPLEKPGEFTYDERYGYAVTSLQNVLWWEDGSLAILTLGTEKNPQGILVTQPFFVKSNVYLPILGANLRWGKP
jgi:WD40 repeat protein